MQQSLLLNTAAAALLGALGGAPLASAQPAQSARAEAQAQSAEVEAARREDEAAGEAKLREAEAHQRDLQKQLEQAQRQLEDAARDVARLSSQNPVLRDFERRFRYAGQRAMLGVSIEDTERGARVAGVSPGGPAADAGLKVGDTILSIEGAGLAAPRNAGGAGQSPTDRLLDRLADVDPGESVKLHVLAEKGGERDVTVQAGEITPQFFARTSTVAPLAGLRVTPAKPGQNVFAFNGPSSWSMLVEGNPWSEMQLVALTPELGAYFGSQKGLLVLRGPGSDSLRLQDGDVILDIGGREPTSPEHALRILGSFQPGEMLKITIMRKQRREALEFQMPTVAASRG